MVLPRNFTRTRYRWRYARRTDVTCIPNHIGYSSEISMAFNIGGATR